MGNQSDTFKRIVISTTTVIFFYFVLNGTLDHFLEEKILEYTNGMEPNKVAMQIGSVTIIFLILAIYEIVYLYSLLQRSNVEKAQLEQQNIQSQLEGLKNQVNPHFLFNSLNTLAHVIPENPERGVSFVQKLSKVYRYILEIREKKLIPLSEELEFLYSYVYLMKERFGENFCVSINIPKENMNDLIIPLSLQILFENAIKHNIVSTKKPLNIEMFVEKDSKLIVRNNLQKKKQVASGTKTGLENIKNRYHFFSDEEVDVVVTQDSFIVVLPLLKNAELIPVR